MADARVSALGYLELGVRDPEAWRHYAERVLGVAAASDGDALALRLDQDVWRVRLVPSGEDDLLTMGLQVADRAALDALGGRLEAQGVEVRTADPARCASRNVQALLLCRDPDGLAIELYVGDRGAQAPFESPQGVQGFVTGGQGLGHMVISVSDVEKADAFYQQGLGFRISDYVVLGQPGRQITLTFLHCNPRHHTLAYGPIPSPKRLNHIMLQAVSLDDVGRALDRALEQNVAITSSLGKHTNDRMLSFYMRTPSGFDVEYGHGGIEVDDAGWQVVSYDAASLWGHRRQARQG